MAAYKKKLLTAKFYVCLKADEAGEEKINKVLRFFEEGVNINEQFSNDSNNTPLHLSVMNGDLVLVDLLLRHGAETNYKNLDDKTALDISLELNSDVSTAIIDTLLTNESKKNINIEKIHTTNVTATLTSVTKLEENNPKLEYRKRGGTSGIKRQLYVSNLLSLIFIRASLKNSFNKFYLGTGLNALDNFNDICIRYKHNNVDGIVCIQTKHKSEGKKGKITYQDLWQTEGDFSLQKYFESYLLILNIGRSGGIDGDAIFKRVLNETKCSVVIYTTAECDLKEKFIGDVDSMDKNIRDLISTGDVTNIYKYNYNNEDIALLTNKNLMNHMENIGVALANYISTRNVDDLVKNSSIQKFHIVLAHKVLIISEVMPDGFRLGGFRDEFLLNYNDNATNILKLALFKTLIESNVTDKGKLIQLIKNVRLEPSVISISRLMQYIPTSYNQYHNTLYVVDQRYRDITYILHDVKVNKETFNEAFHLSINEVLGKIYIPLPSRFGNVDIAIEDVKNRMDILENYTKAMIKFFEQQENIQNFNQNLNKEHASSDLQMIWSLALGNLLIIDERTNLLKLNTNEKYLYKNGKALLKRLKNKIDYLDEISFNMNLKGLPKLKLEADDDEKEKAISFLDNLWFYTSQSTENKIEDQAIDIVQDYYIANKGEISDDYSSARYEAVYFSIREAVQKWWLTDGMSHYLTNDMKLMNKLLNEISRKSMLNILSCMFISKMRQFNVKFNKDAIDYLHKQLKSRVTVIITNVSLLTGIKLVQCFQNSYNHVFIDLDNSMNLSKTDYVFMVQELKNMKLKALILFYEDVTETKNKIFQRLTEKPIANDLILITNENSAEKLRLYITYETSETITDTRNDLNDLDFISQENVMSKTFIFQGGLVKFLTILTPQSKFLIKSVILQKIINNETIEIGKTLSDPYFEEIAQYIVPRTLCRIKDLSHDDSLDFEKYSNVHNKEIIKVTSLEHLKNTVVLIGAPGMGKSTFLTYLSLLTKIQNPSVWVERINLLDQTKELHQLQQKKNKIDKIDALKFVCKSVLSRNAIRFNIKPESIITFDLQIDNGELMLKNYDRSDILMLLELQMFIHCYNQGNTILLFDGFDEICPHYKREMTELLKCLIIRCSPLTIIGKNENTKQKMWIASRSYNNIRETLETEFGVAYNLEMFTDDEQSLFMTKYFKINLNFDDLSIEEFQKIDVFFEFMNNTVSSDIEQSGLKVKKLSSIFLNSIYFAALSYFNSEINKSLRDIKKSFKQKWNAICKSLEASYTFKNFKYYYINRNVGLLEQYGNKEKLDKAASMIFTPLHVYMILDYFHNQIKDVDSHNRGTEIWNLEKNTSSFYKYFLETKLKKIRFQEKNQMDIYNPGIAITYEKEFKEFMIKHKKLAFYSTFKGNLGEILSDTDIHDIVNTIEGMKAGQEKTGIVDCILSGDIPRFVHFSFQEYFAMEYLSDLLTLKRAEQLMLWKFILRNIRDGVLDFFDRKLELDDGLSNIITDTKTKQMIFEDIMSHLDANENTYRNRFLKKTLLGCALNLGLRETTRTILKAMADVVDQANLDKFINFIKKSTVFKSVAILNWDDILHIILDSIRNVDMTKLRELEPGVFTTVYNKITNEEIITDYKLQVKIIIDLNNKERL